MPHPDDEAVFIAGLLKKLSRNKIRAKLVTVTAGEKSTLRYGLSPAADLAEVRKIELAKALAILGITDYAILGFSDSNLTSQSETLAQAVSLLIRDFKPSHVVTLEPDGIYGHPDHISLSRAVSEVVVPPVQLLYATIAIPKVKPKASAMSQKVDINPLPPQYCLKLGLVEKMAKLNALRAHSSQFKISRTDSKDFNFFQANRMLSNEYFTYRPDSS